MSQIATAKLSSRGQIVIPEEIRNKMGLHIGDQFLVLAEKDIVILKMIVQPNMTEYEMLIAKARKSAKTVGLTRSSVKSIIKAVRKN
ncbi:MAG TPA: AbrB/MazE/SpoVT family DNA-binding domain-containing protein [Aquella sp.]|nr:AbrB/MazE/SpoVT family DNA-binding domain-containing protein [Aquella sp.]